MMLIANELAKRIEVFLATRKFTAVLTRAYHCFCLFFFFGATAPILALAYLHETIRFTSVY
jgi:hypothetical protein